MVFHPKKLIYCSYVSFYIRFLKTYYSFYLRFVQTINREPSNHSTITLCKDKTIVYKNITIVVQRGLMDTESCVHESAYSTNKTDVLDTLRLLQYKKIILYYENTPIIYLFLCQTESVGQMWITCIMSVCMYNNYVTSK